MKNVKGLTKIDIPKSRTSFVANVFRKDSQEDAPPGKMFGKSESLHANAGLYEDDDSEPQRSAADSAKGLELAKKAPVAARK